MIKLIRLALLIAAVGYGTMSSAQSCDSLLKSETDKFTDKVDLKSDLLQVSNEIFLQVRMSDFAGMKNTISISLITSEGLNCIDQGAKVILLLKDKTKLELLNGSSYNCKGITSLYFYTSGMGSKKLVSQLDKIADVGISAIRIFYSTAVKDIDFDDATSATLSRITSCLLMKAGKR